MPGALWRYDASSSTSPRASASAAQASKSVDQPGACGLDPELLEEGQAVGEEARPDDQHALVAQRAQPPAEVEQPAGVVRGQRQLEDRDVAGRVHDLQRHPRAVVEAPAGVLVHRLVVGHHRGDPGRQAGGVGGRVLLVVVLRREAAEVVDQRGARRGGAQADRRGLPVRRHDQDRLSGGAGRWPSRAAVRSRPGRRGAEVRRGRCTARACARQPRGVRSQWCSWLQGSG